VKSYWYKVVVFLYLQHPVMHVYAARLEEKTQQHF